MDDKFLYQLQEQPDREFARKLYSKLRQYDLEPGRRHYFKKLVQITALFVFAAVAVMAISPARAFVSSLIINIAGQVFAETNDYPGDNYDGGEIIVEPQVMALGDALAVFPYPVQLPTHVPSEYILIEDKVRLYAGNEAGPFANTIEFDWRSATPRGISLKVADHQWEEIVAPNAVEEILLDGAHPAALIRGGWDADQKVWADIIGFRLRWSMDNLFYELAGTDKKLLLEIAISTLK